MVFNATEETNDTDQPTNKNKHRKTTPTGRKNRSVASNLSPTKEVLSPPGKTVRVSPTGTDKSIMGNTSAQRSGNDVTDLEEDISQAEVNHDCSKKGGNESNNGSACLLPQNNIQVYSFVYS